MTDWRTVYPQQRAEDLYLSNCFRYYVLHAPTMPDASFDAMHRFLLNLYPHSPVLHWVGSDDASHYPLYIARGWRPTEAERRTNDSSLPPKP